MAKKKGSPKDPGVSAQSIWLAGLGALATAEQKGSKVFHHLVDMGEAYDRALRGEARKASTELKSRAGKARHRAGTVWKRLEEGFEEQVRTALKRLELPTRDEISRLNRKVEELTRSIEAARPRKKRAAKRKATARRTAKKGSKPTARKTPSRKPPKKKPAKKTGRKARARA